MRLKQAKLVIERWSYGFDVEACFRPPDTGKGEDRIWRQRLLLLLMSFNTESGR